MKQERDRPPPDRYLGKVQQTLLTFKNYHPFVDFHQLYLVYQATTAHNDVSNHYNLIHCYLESCSLLITQPATLQQPMCHNCRAELISTNNVTLIAMCSELLHCSFFSPCLIALI